MTRLSAYRPGVTTAPPSQPNPLHTTVIAGPHGDDPATAIVRTWDGRDVPSCGLCPAGRCKARRTAMRVEGADGRKARAYVCTVVVLGDIAPLSAPLFALAALPL